MEKRKTSQRHGIAVGHIRAEQPMGRPWASFFRAKVEGVSIGQIRTRSFAVADRSDIAVHVADVGLACCGMEFAAALTRGLLVRRLADEPRADVHVLVVSGTVTDILAPAVLSSWLALPEPRAAIAFGACTASGGPYWDSYAVTKGIDQLLPVTSYVPGCPPRPEALLRTIIAVATSAGAGQPADSSQVTR